MIQMREFEQVYNNITEITLKIFCGNRPTNFHLQAF